MQIGGESNLALLLIFTIGGLIFGGLVVYLIMSTLRTQRDAKEDLHTHPLPKMNANPESEEDEIVRGLDESVPIQPAMEIKEGGDPVSDLQQDFSLWHSVGDGQYFVKIDDSWYDGIESMDQNLRGRFLDNLKLGASWFDLSLMKEKSEPVIDIKEAVPVNMKTKTGSLVNNAQPLIVDVPQRKMSIVEQVDSILQEILQEEGLTDRNIRLTEMMNRGLVIWVGKEFYDGIDAVPDTQVKQLIRKAVQRWETSDSIR
ncbi:MAG: hypothetical protein CVU46_09090 [Chloroflexi bacterium HGW-Chloroflexi-8]|jgi:hypothetical protein|nr:MAG: hypothetical protein CVU46_09090 [Chloroflexi bacterium HGW-Chloroflexi-8]